MPFSEFFGHKLGLASYKMNMVKTCAMAQSSKISLVGIYYQKKQPFPTFFKIKHWKQDHNPRFLNKTETKIRKIQSPGHNAYTSNKKNLKICLWSNYMSMIYDQTIRTKQSILASILAIHSCSNQFKFCCIKANAIHLHCYI